MARAEPNRSVPARWLGRRASLPSPRSRRALTWAASRRQGGQAARARIGAERRGGRGCSLNHPLFSHSRLCKAVRRPAAFIGGWGRPRRPDWLPVAGARADQLMRIPAPRPLGELPSGRRRGGGEQTRERKKRKGPWGRGVGEGSEEGRAEGRVPAGKDPEGPAAARRRARTPPPAEPGRCLQPLAAFRLDI